LAFPERRIVVCQIGFHPCELSAASTLECVGALPHWNFDDNLLAIGDGSDPVDGSRRATDGTSLAIDGDPGEN
jgi:hypothetical protein